MKKASICLLALTTFICLIATPVIAAPTVNLDGQQLSFDVPPMIENNRTLVPLRAIFEALGTDVQWDEKTQTISATSTDKNLKLIIGSFDGYIDGEIIRLDVAPQIVNGRTFVPLRFVSEAFGSNVSWDSAAQVISITTKDSDTLENGNWIYTIDCANKLVSGIELDNSRYLFYGNFLKASSQYSPEHLSFFILNSMGELLDFSDTSTSSFSESPVFMTSTEDNGLICSVFTGPEGNRIAAVCKINSDWKAQQWYFRYKSPGNVLTNIVENSNHEYVFALSTISESGNMTHLIKIDKNANIALDKTIGIETINCIQCTSDGGFIMAGSSVNSEKKSTTYCIKVDKDGNTQWSKTYEEYNICSGNCIQQANDGYIITGKSLVGNICPETSSAYVLKIDNSGTPVWKNTYVELNRTNDIKWICNTDDGGFVFTGATRMQNSSNTDLWLAKIDKDGKIVFDKRFGSEYDDGGLHVVQTSDGGFLTSGYVGTSEHDYKGFIVKTDANGALH